MHVGRLTSCALAGVLSGVLVASTGAGLARADGKAPTSTGNEFSGYERASIAEVLAGRGAEVDPAPEGKTVEAIDVVPLDVIEKRDPAPEFLDALHTTTRPYVIDREVLLRPGDWWQQSLADESTRNLRGLIQLSLVVVLPVRGSAPDKVRVLVITKDVWSLRLNSDARIVSGGKIEYLLLQPSEWNVAGTHHNAGVQFVLQPLSYSLGGTYTIPRLLGSWVQLHGDANVIVNRHSGAAEGSYGSVSAFKPLYSALEEWNWGVSTAWRKEVTRRYVNGELSSFVARSASTNNAIPFEYGTSVAVASAYLTRSYGWEYKHDFTLGWEASRRAYRTFDLAPFDPSAAAEFVRRVLPIDDTRNNPFVEWESYTNDFLRVLDFETLALQEDFRLGHDVLVKAYPMMRALGSTHDFFGVSSAAYYTAAVGDGLIRAGVEGIVETGKDGVGDALVESKQRIHTPRFALGRFVFDARQLFRPRDALNRTSFLGGEGRLRGYPTHYTFGRDLVAYSFEFRSRPVELFTVQLGAVAFWDTGDAFDDVSQMDLKHGAGFGLRALFPQLDRYVLRADMGFPVARQRPAGTHPFEVVVTFQQAFPVPGPTRGTVFTER